MPRRRMSRPKAAPKAARDLAASARSRDTASVGMRAPPRSSRLVTPPNSATASANSSRSRGFALVNFGAPLVRPPSPNRYPTSLISHSRIVCVPKTSILRGTATSSPTRSSPNGRQPWIVRNGCVIVVSTRRPRRVVTRKTGLSPSSYPALGSVRRSFQSSPNVRSVASPAR